ncbi:MAG: hypothetical protein ABJC09_10080 [Terriglobia bacterium]
MKASEIFQGLIPLSLGTIVMCFSFSFCGLAAFEPMTPQGPRGYVAVTEEPLRFLKKPRRGSTDHVQAFSSSAVKRFQNPQSENSSALDRKPSPYTAQDDELLLAALSESGPIQDRFRGRFVFLDENPEFRERYAAIAKRAGVDPPPDILVAMPFTDKHGPGPQKPDSGVSYVTYTGGRIRDVVLLTEYLRKGLTNDAQLLAVVAHETRHSAQLIKEGHNLKKIHGKKIESDADKFALSCPEVDPAAFKDMLIRVDQLQNEAARKHPLMYGDVTGSTKIIPVSVQTMMAFGGNHPMTSTRVHMAEAEEARRAGGARTNPEQKP